MSLYGAMNTSISGMQAQTNKLGTVGDNLANASTTGYKKSYTAFSSLVMPYQPPGGYSSGGVETTVRRSIDQQGGLSFTTSSTDLAINGHGFFVVEDQYGGQYLTRAGDFQKDDQGYLLNSSGYRLMGYGADDSALEAIQLGRAGLNAKPSTSGIFDVNLSRDANAATSVIMDAPPSANSPNSTYTKKSSSVSENALGEVNATDIYYTKAADNTWEVTVYQTYGSPSSGFPYDMSSGDVTMATTTLTFDPDTGALVSGNPKIFPDPADNYFYDFSSLLQGDDTASGGIGSKENFISTTPAIDTAAGEVPASANVASASYVSKTTHSGYAGLPQDIAIDQYVTKTSANTWEVAFYNHADATNGGFPYGAAGSAPLATRELTFDPTTGKLATGGGAFNVTIPNVGKWTVDFSDTVSKPDYHSAEEDGIKVSLDLPESAVPIKPYLAGTVASQNQSNSTYTNKTSITAYDNAGGPVTLDVYYTKGPNNIWEVSVFDQRDSLTGGFPYGAPGSAPLASAILEFDPTTTKLKHDVNLDIPIAGGQTINLDLSGTTLLASDFSVATVKLDGSKASAPTGYSISPDGIVSASYEDGSLVKLSTIALADVMSPNNMTAVDGTAFRANNQSGPAMMGFAGLDGMGTIKSGAYESSNVDIASELTDMIEAQRTFTANSKVFQTGSEMYDVLNGLKR